MGGWTSSRGVGRAKGSAVTLSPPKWYLPVEAKLALFDLYNGCIETINNSRFAALVSNRRERIRIPEQVLYTVC